MYEGKYPVRPKRRRRRHSGLIPGTILIVLLITGCFRVFASDAPEETEPPVSETTESIPTSLPTDPPEPTEPDEIDLAADALLDTLISDGATTREQIQVIYNWARGNLSYGGHSDRTDWRQAAYTMLTEYRGDCYGYFAVTKLLFERLGIPNIDVQKVRNHPEDSDHFWSLVSTDGGESWYHFDATPRYGSGDDFCLVTDKFLDVYSDSHNGSHNRDTSLYPATPQE